MELGSEFNLDFNKLNVCQNNLFQYLKKFNYRLFDSGRSAIKSIPFDNSKKVLLPEFICESVINCFEKEKLVFYRIKDNMQIDFEDIQNKLTADVGIILVVHYFGACQPSKEMQQLSVSAKSVEAVLVEDTTQSLFSVQEQYGDYYVASIRKWMQIPAGGVVYSEKALPQMNYEKSCDNEKAFGMALKTMFLRDGFDCNLKYRQIFASCEKVFDESKDIREISDFCKYIISCVDVDELIERRKNNFKYLKSNLEILGIKSVCEFADTDCPLVFPVRMKNRDAFRAYLMEHSIYCAVHWPFDDVQEENRCMGKYNADTLISLPLDQRYEKEEMDYMIGVISDYKDECYVKSN